jgi:hypothetical protein
MQQLDQVGLQVKDEIEQVMAMIERRRSAQYTEAWPA